MPEFVVTRAYLVYRFQRRPGLDAAPLTLVRLERETIDLTPPRMGAGGNHATIARLVELPAARVKPRKVG